MDDLDRVEDEEKMAPDWLRTFKNWIIFHTFRGSQAFLLIAPQWVSFLYIKTTFKKNIYGMHSQIFDWFDLILFCSIERLQCSSPIPAKFGLEMIKMHLCTLGFWHYPLE